MGRNRPDVPGTLFKEADVDKDGSVAANELKETFVRWLGEWDGNKDASLGEEELQKGLTALLPAPAFPGGGQFRGPGAGGAGGPQMRAMPGPGRNMPRVEGVKLDPLVTAKDETKPLISKLLAVPEW